MAEPRKSSDESAYKPLQIQPPSPSRLRRWANLIAGGIAVAVLGCPISMFIGLMYQRWQHLPYNSIHWSGVFAFAIAYILITVACMIVLILKAKRSP